jgi:signal transduction histidine kinase
MIRLRMRTKLLLSLLLVSGGLTSTSLVVARRVIERQARTQIFQDLRNSLSTFENLQRQRQLSLARTARVLADLPIVRALMTTDHPPTIQDGSRDLRQLAASDLLALGDPTGKLMALHTSAAGFSRDAAHEALLRSMREEQADHWWFGGEHLYEVSVQPIYFGAPSQNRLLGFLAIGYEIDDRVAHELSQVAASQVAFRYGNEVVRSTLSHAEEAEFLQLSPKHSQDGVEDVQLGEERFLIASVELAHGAGPIRLSVLKSLDQATAFLTKLNQSLVILGIVAVLVGAGLVFLISHTFTRPLGNLVAGVRALEKGDFSYPLESRRGDEVAEVTGAFGRMRNSLHDTQRRLLESERLATIGRMASSISHDLRHCLAAIMANAEFLSENNRNHIEREELYQEIRVAVNQMTDLIDSLLEFSRTRESLTLTHGRVENAIERAAQTVRAHPEFHEFEISIQRAGNTAGYFDVKKLERVFQNLLLNACEAALPNTGKIEVQLRETEDGLEIRVADNGRGIPEAIRDKVFAPFVSQGKENGTGLGLTVIQKIMQDHGGDIGVENTSVKGTVFRLFLPRISPVRLVSDEVKVGIPAPVRTKAAE